MSTDTVDGSDVWTRENVDQFGGAMLLEFGAEWCPHCQAAEPLIHSALQKHPQVKHLRIEDGKGKHLGRSFGVTLWPTLIFLKDGLEMKRLTRPVSAAPIEAALTELEA